MACPLHPGWLASEDRALKLEAIESGGVATTALLKSWMDHYQMCCDGRAAYTIGDGGGTREKQKKGSKRDKENGGRGRRVQLDGDVVRRSHLMVLRERPIRAGFRTKKRKENVKRARDIKSPPQNVAQCRRFCNTATRRPLLLLCSRVHEVICPLLYHHIEVESGALSLVDSLARNPKLPPMVHSLIFWDSDATQVEVTQWRVALVAMRNLKLLCVCRTIPLPSNIMPVITFRLKTFGSTGVLVGEWAAFVVSQDQIERLWLNSDFFGRSPRAVELPALRSMKGRAGDLARFARHHHLRDLWFFMPKPRLSASDLRMFALSPARLSTIRIGTRYFVHLLEWAPRLVTSLADISLDEDPTWAASRIRASNLDDDGGDITVKGDGWLARLAAVLDARFSYLKSVRLLLKTSQNGSQKLLKRGDGQVLCMALSAHCAAPVLQMFHADAYDGYPPPVCLSPPFLVPFAMDTTKQKKKKKIMRSLLPRQRPLPPALEVKVHPKIHAKPLTPPQQSRERKDPSPEPQARWDWDDWVNMLITQDGKMEETSDDNPGEEKKGEGVDQEREQLWDSVMSGVMDAMKPWEQREWRAEERLAEEREERWGSPSRLEKSDSSWGDTSARDTYAMMCADGGIWNVLEDRHFVIDGIAGVHNRDGVGSVLHGNSSASEAEVGVKAVMESSWETEKWKIEYIRNEEKWEQFEEIGGDLFGWIETVFDIDMAGGDKKNRKLISRCNGMWVHSDLAPVYESVEHGRTKRIDWPVQRHVVDPASIEFYLPAARTYELRILMHERTFLLHRKSRDAIVMQALIDFHAAVAAITRAERRIQQTMGEYRTLIGTTDRDRGERYIDMDKISATTPPQVVISYDPTNFIVPKCHSARFFYDVGLTDIEGSERWWDKVKPMAKL
ncbi:hypothetical protein B0H14DRAFT_2557310 [Mycena olivaceomarginata]|nr:hypothetical protein B0H14DRAFT_2557310 [Mycena olivaceomarginata]